MKKKKTATPGSTLRVAALNLNGAEQLGTENIEKSFDIILEVAEIGIDLSQDFKYRKLFSFGLKVASYGNLVDLFKKALAEFKDLDKQEAARVNAYIDQRFDITNDGLEASIEKGIDLIERTYNTAPVMIELGADWMDWVNSWKKVS